MRSRCEFTGEEDNMLMNLVEVMGTNDWQAISNKIETKSARQCRERWNNYLSPALTSSPWSEEEDDLLLQLFENIGPKWTQIASFFRNRSSNAVRNRFRLKQKKELMMIKKYKSDQKLLNESKNTINDTSKSEEKRLFELFDNIDFSQEFNFQPKDLVMNHI